MDEFEKRTVLQTTILVAVLDGVITAGLVIVTDLDSGLIALFAVVGFVVGVVAIIAAGS